MQIDLAGMKVMMGISLITTTIPRNTVFSIAKTMYDAGRIGLDLSYSMGCASNNDRARDMVVDGFLRSGCEKLFWIDADMVWEPQDFFKLVALSTQVDVVLASYPAKVEGDVPFFVDFDMPAETNRHGLLKINGAGLGFCCMDRKVVQAVADKSPTIHDSSIGRIRKKIFRHDVSEERAVEFEGKLYPSDRTEDFAFFSDITDCDFDIWLDPFIELGHVGTKEWRAKFADASNIVKTNEQVTK